MMSMSSCDLKYNFHIVLTELNTHCLTFWTNYSLYPFIARHLFTYCITNHKIPVHNNKNKASYAAEIWKHWREMLQTLFKLAD